MHSKSTRALLVFVAVLTMSAVATSSAWAAGKPLVETKPATTITKSEATLNGTVDPNGAETTYHFEYGTSISYGKSTAEVYVGSGTTGVEELQKVASLLAEKAYDFRIVATNSNGTTDGANEAFTTSGPKVPLAETVGASAVTETGAALNGVVNPNGVETKYHFQYGTSISYGKETAAVSAGAGTANLNESATISGLTSKKTYHYRIVATNANGTTDGPDQTFYSEVGPEFNPDPAKNQFTGTTGTWEVKAGNDIYACTKGTASGEIVGGRDVGNVLLTFTGCKSSANSGGSYRPLNSVGAKEGEIVSRALTGELGTVATKEAPSGVALLLKREAATKPSWWTLAGNGETIEATWQGSVAYEVPLIGKKQTTNKLVSHVGGITKIKLDSGVESEPEFNYFGIPVGWASTYDLTFAEALEVT
jgi:hypothetical protein